MKTAEPAEPGNWHIEKVCPPYLQIAHPETIVWLQIWSLQIQRANCIYWKKKISLEVDLHTVQIRVVQGATVHCFFVIHVKENLVLSNETDNGIWNLRRPHWVQTLNMQERIHAVFDRWVNIRKKWEKVRRTEITLPEKRRLKLNWKMFQVCVKTRRSKKSGSGCITAKPPHWGSRGSEMTKGQGGHTRVVVCRLTERPW